MNVMPNLDGQPLPDHDADEIAPSPIDLPSIPDVIYRTMRRDIARGVYKPGPLRVRPIAERFGVSATPVREALRRLQAEGLVSLRNRQIVVNALSAREAREIYSIRAELEAMAVRQAGPRITGDPALLRKLETLIEDMDRYEHDPEAWRTANEEFHMAIYRVAQMPRLEGMIISLWIAVEPYLRRYVNTAPSFRAAQEQHLTILHALEAGEVETAAETMHAHMLTTSAVLVDGLGSDEAS